MRRTAGWAIGVVWVLAVLVGACRNDPCAYGSDLPSCQTNKAIANATIATVNAIKRTVQIPAVDDEGHARRDWSAGSGHAVRSTVGLPRRPSRWQPPGCASGRGAGDAAGREQQGNLASVEAAATQNAISLRATVQAIQVIATQTALERAGQTRSGAAGQRRQHPRSDLHWGLVIVIVVMSGVGFVWYGRRVLVAVTNFL